MLKVMTFGDRPAANILAKSVNIVSEDNEISTELAELIKHGFFVDYGGTSSIDKEKKGKECVRTCHVHFPSIHSTLGIF